MNVIVCIDDDNGMLFNNRRQSRDKILIDNVIKTASNSDLYVEVYSEPLFENAKEKVIVSNDLLNEAKQGDYCFVETLKIEPYIDKIERFIIYHWNRRYPSDVQFDIDLNENGFKLVSTEEFKGNSHDKITKEIYEK